jgi:peptidoglycan/LPS O-acetylase OafA/YrhL
MPLRGKQISECVTELALSQQIQRIVCNVWGVVGQTIERVRTHLFTIRRSKGKLPRRSDVQGLRAIAVLMVVAYHANLPIPGGFAGVDVFFVISGFVITAMLRRELESTGRIDFRQFYARRVRRLLPALAIVTIVTLAVAAFLQPPLGLQQTAARTGAATSVFVANAQILREGNGYFDLKNEMNPFLHMWSLGVEEQFYFFFPALLFSAWLVAKRLRLNRARSAAAAVAVVSAFSLAICIWLTFRSERASSLAFYSSPTRVWEFGAGALLALAATRMARWHKAAGVAMSFAGVVLLIAACKVITSASAFPGYIALLPVAGAALVIAGGTVGTNAVSRLLSQRPLTFLGDISFGWYLWHWPAVVFASQLFQGSTQALVTVSVLALVPAWMSFRYLETPIRHSPFFKGPRVLGLAVACITVPALLGLSVLYGANNGWGRPENPQLMETSAVKSLSSETGCHATRTASRSKIESCVLPAAGDTTKGWILVAGDSHADSLAAGVSKAAEGLGYEFRQSTASACSLSEIAPRETMYVSNCGDIYNWTMDMIRGDNPPSLVVITNYTWARIRYLETKIPDAQQQWTDGLRSTISKIGDAGIPVLLVTDVPRMGVPVESCRFGSVLPMDCGISRAESDELARSAREAEMEAVANVPNASTVDLSSYFCDERRCDPIIDGKMMYKDANHLNRLGSEYVAPALQEAAAKAMAG